MALDIEVLGNTQTERLIYLTLTTQGPLELTELLRIIGGSAGYAIRTLRAMQREGYVRTCTISAIPYKRGYEALTVAQRQEWITSACTWVRDEPNGFWGNAKTSVGSQANSVPIKDAAALEREIDRLWQENWFRLGDEQALRNLFPEFTSSAVTE
jgi:hypothetical protein